MDEIGFQPKLEDLQSFYKKRDKKIKKIKEIDQILSFNNRQSKIKDGEHAFDNEFDQKTWNSIQNNDKRVDFFEQEAKNLLSNERSCKRLNQWNLVFDQILHLLALSWCIRDSYPFWSYLMSILVLVVNAYFIFFNLSKKCFQHYKKYQNWRKILNKFYEYLLISSILAAFASVIHGIFIIAVNEAFILGVKFVIYLGIIRIQLKLIKDIKYIIWIEKESTKMESIDQNIQSQSFQMN